jgi:spermidine synthase
MWRRGARGGVTARRRAQRVQVRESRRGRALRIDGTFASWYAPGSPLTGSVWDALAAPLLLLPPARRRSVLVLGLGGGSAARVVRALAPRARIVGVEHSAEVLRVARRRFDLGELDLEVVQADARQYLERTRRHFDAIIEDVFVGRGRAVCKPDWLPCPGLARVARRLRRGGLLISNSIDETATVAREMRSLFASTLCIDVADYDNRVVVGGPAPLTGRALRSAVAAHPLLCATLERLSFRTLAR